jgi:multidrug efflux pump subunit AcrA (membrane-fusion protein)
MKRSRPLWIGLALAAAALAVAGAFAFSSKDDQVPTFVVSAEKFERRVTADGNLSAVKSTKISLPTDIPQPLTIAWIAEDGSFVAEGDVVMRFDPTQFESALVTGLSEQEVAQNKGTSGEASAGATRKNLRRDADLAEKELDTARSRVHDDEDVFSRYERIESGLDEELAAEKRDYAYDVLSIRERLIAAERALVGIEESKAILRIRNAEKGLKALELVAPHGGILVFRKDWRGETPRVGSTVWPGNPLGEIPDASAMQAEVFVLEADAAGLAVAQNATVTIASDPNRQFKGKVTRVDKLARPRMRNVPVQYFGATVTLDRTDPSVMKPGARVRAVLEIEQQAGVFPVPRQAVFEKEGKKIVYRREGGTFVPVSITVGSGTPGRVLVTSGVKAGDVLAIRDPTEEADETERPS